MSFILIPVVQPQTQVVYGTGGGITSSGSFRFDPDQNTIYLKDHEFVASGGEGGQVLQINGADGDASSGRGASVEVNGGSPFAGSGEFGGNVSITAGSGDGIAGGSDITLTAGNGDDAQGASASLVGGQGTQSGRLLMNSGAASGGAQGGSILLERASDPVGGFASISSGSFGGSFPAALNLTGSDEFSSGRFSLGAGLTPEGSTSAEIIGETATGVVGGDLFLTAGANPSFSGAGAEVTLSGGGNGGAFGGDLTMGPGAGTGANGVLNLNNVIAANNGQVVTVGNVGPGGAGVAIVGWVAVTVDGTPGFLPLFA